MINKPNKVILHCSATKDSRESRISVWTIDKWHKERGWKGIGYHYYVTRDGVIHKGRDPKIVGAHCFGQNENSLGVCYEGTYFPTVTQVTSLAKLYQEFRLAYGIEAYQWHGHNEFSDKQCPGFAIKNLTDLFLMVS